MKLKAEFVSRLQVSIVDDDTWKLSEDLAYNSKIMNRTILVPRGFVTDFASVPRVPLAYLLAGGCAKEAAVVHDWFYQTHQSGTRLKADRIFLEAMKASGIAMWRAHLMFLAVRCLGMSSWATGPDRKKRLERLAN